MGFGGRLPRLCLLGECIERLVNSFLSLPGEVCLSLALDEGDYLLEVRHLGCLGCALRSAVVVDEFGANLRSLC